MSLPAFLPYGIVSIYGIGSAEGLNGIVPPPEHWWGVIDQVSQYEIYWAQVGDSVLFPESGVVCRLAYPTENAIFTLVPEVKLVCQEYPAP